jgi:hypothetical protein
MKELLTEGNQGNKDLANRKRKYLCFLRSLLFKFNMVAVDEHRLRA